MLCFQSHDLKHFLSFSRLFDGGLTYVSQTATSLCVGDRMMQDSIDAAYSEMIERDIDGWKFETVRGYLE